MLDYFPTERPHILAHRGLALAAVENSLDAFRAALNAGATHIETDAQATLDGIAVLFHDDVFDSRPISHYLHEELPSYIPTLDEALRVFPDARFNIDIKSKGAIQPVADTVRAHGAARRVLIASFSEKRRRETVQHITGIASSASARQFTVALLAAKIGLNFLVRRALGNVDAIQIPTRGAGMKTVTRRTLAAYKSAGVVVHVWTVNDPIEMERLVLLGVDGIVTDRTDLAYTQFSQGR